MGVLVALPLITLPASASGQGDPDAPPQEICALCHSLDGVSRMSKFPRLAGQKASYIEKQLKDFRAGRRSNDGGQMASIVTEIREDQIPEVANYFATLPAPPVIDGRPADAAAIAKPLILKGDHTRGLPACATCHMPELADETDEAVPNHAPRLTSQHPDYLAKQLRDFRQGQRANDTTGIMAGIAKALTDQEIEALASYLGSLKRKATNVD